MAHTFTLPDLGEGLTEGEIARWLVREGQAVSENEPIVEIQTDKATVEVGSPVAGVVLRIVVREGEIAPVGATLAVIGAEGEQLLRPVAMLPVEPPPPAEPIIAVVGSDRSRRCRLHRLARELSVELASVKGTGPGGRVTEDDVRAARGARRGAARAGARDPAGDRRAGRAHASRDPRRDVRRGVRLHRRRTAPSSSPTALKAAAASLREFPELNARIEGDEIVLLDRYDLGVAVDTEAGLVVPVVRGCDRLSVAEIDAEIERLADGARAGTLQPDELRDSTFTVTSAGRLGGIFVTPLINHPEVAILGLHRIGPRPVVRDGEVVVREMGNVSVTFDHRVVDGARAGAFCVDVIRRLEQHGRVRTLIGSGMGDWYDIGITVGIGVAAGVAFAGVLAGPPLRARLDAARRDRRRRDRRPARERVAGRRGRCRRRRHRLGLRRDGGPRAPGAAARRPAARRCSSSRLPS